MPKGTDCKTVGHGDTLHKRRRIHFIKAKPSSITVRKRKENRFMVVVIRIPTRRITLCTTSFFCFEPGNDPPNIDVAYLAGLGGKSSIFGAMTLLLGVGNRRLTRSRETFARSVRDLERLHNASGELNTVSAPATRPEEEAFYRFLRDV